MDFKPWMSGIFSDQRDNRPSSIWPLRHFSCYNQFSQAIVQKRKSFMKFEAVIFDLFGTLVDSPSLKYRQNVLEKIAGILGVAPLDFITLWDETLIQRDTGALPHFGDVAGYIGGRLGLSFTSERIEKATKLRMDYVRRLVVPRPQAVPVLSQLKSHGYKTGLISDCSLEVSSVWPATSLASLIEVVIFSCMVNMKKPDPRIYEMMAKRLDVPPSKCLYVGDGSSHELTGASAAGMFPVMIKMQDTRMVFQTEAESDQWTGPMISSLPEVCQFLQ